MHSQCIIFFWSISSTMSGMSLCPVIMGCACYLSVWYSPCNDAIINDQFLHLISEREREWDLKGKTWLHIKHTRIKGQETCWAYIGLPGTRISEVAFVVFVTREQEFGHGGYLTLEILLILFIFNGSKTHVWNVVFLLIWNCSLCKGCRRKSWLYTVF